MLRSLVGSEMCIRDRYVFLDAPHLLSAQHLQARRVATGRVSTENEPRSLEGDPPRSWYMVEEDGRYQEDSIAASMAAVERCCLESGPFDGVLGFSQGASMAALVAARMIPLKFKFVALFSGFLPRDEALEREVEAASARLREVRSFHCFGRSDEIIPACESGRLAELFGEELAVRFEHGGGHYIPSDKPMRQGFKRFLLEQQAHL
eukprot:TRINITY_DN3601_c0_g1_i7.p1 TRINITY_DN3601_c0_g1~~TRINITY_DN3601_c0_g1_i7.p1  ORF type:complete len:206 (+),score=53.30 TRINITY_DN3601_c0_g1_i7:146-763(+)